MRTKTNRSLKHTVIISILALGLTAQACETSGPKGVWKSTDAGQSWSKINLVSIKGKKPSAALDSVDIKQIVGAPDMDELLYASTPVGVFATDNGGKLWHQVLPSVNVQEVAVSESDPSTVYAVGSIQGRGVVYKSGNRGRDWERKYIEPAENVAFTVVVNPQDPNDVFVGFDSGLLINTLNGGESWRVAKTFTSRVVKLGFHASGADTIMVLLRREGLWFSEDRGLTFDPITSALTQRFSLSEAAGRSDFKNPSIFIGFDFDEAAPQVIYVITDVGLFRTADTGGSWAQMRLPVDPRSALTLALDTSAAGRLLYVSINTIVYRSIDGGRTFTTVKLPTERLIRAIFALPDNPDIVYAGTTK